MRCRTAWFLKVITNAELLSAHQAEKMESPFIFFASLEGMIQRHFSLKFS